MGDCSQKSLTKLYIVRHDKSTRYVTIAFAKSENDFQKLVDIFIIFFGCLKLVYLMVIIFSIARFIGLSVRFNLSKSLKQFFQCKNRQCSSISSSTFILWCHGNVCKYRDRRYVKGTRVRVEKKQSIKIAFCQVFSNVHSF